MGFENRDGNGEFQTGFMIPQGTIRRGSRCSTSKAFLRPIRHRKNLHIAMHSTVTQIIINPETKKAEGVKFRRNGKLKVFRMIYYYYFKVYKSMKIIFTFEKRKLCWKRCKKGLSILIKSRFPLNYIK